MNRILTIRLFDHFQLTYGDEHIISVKGARVRSLLAYLLLNREAAVMRQRLAFLLWPDSSEAQARTNLRRELHFLRRELPDADQFLHIRAEVLQWRSDSPFRLDVGEFEAACIQAGQADQAGDHTALQVALESGVTIYAGDLLPSLYDDWLVPERERLSQLYAGLLERLVQLFERRREYDQAVRYARRLLSHDPLHEATYRHLMRLHAVSGDRAQALRVYHTCVTTLRQELDIEPSPTTHAIYEQLISVDRTAAARHAVELIPVSRNRLVGRRATWETMQTAWQNTASDRETERARLILVNGDAGIGKTRLVEEFLERAARQGIETASAHCYATEGQLAFAPIAEWLRADCFRDAPLALEEVWLTEAVRLLPELLVERPGLPRPAPLTESGQRLRLFEALTKFVLTGSRPLMLAIDDLQWCDRDSLEWLSFLLRSDSHRRMLLIGTARADELSAEHPLRLLAADLHRSEQVTEIALGPLDSHATAELAEQVIGHELDPEVAADIFLESEGYPLFIVEMARAAYAYGTLPSDGMESVRNSDTTESIAYVGPPIGSSRLPPKIQALIRLRLAPLAPATRGLVELAATIGRSFTYPVLAYAAAPGGQLSEEQLVLGLDELWRRRIIREQGQDAYDFSHDKIREVVYADISRVRQQFLHRRVAKALEAVHASDLDTASGQIAYHFERSGQFQLAAHYYQRAAEHARSIFANHEAKELYSLALEASQNLTPAPNARQLLPLYESRANVCRSLTQTDDALADFEAVYELAHAAQDQQKEGESLYQLAFTHWLTFSEYQMPFVEKYARKAMDLYEENGDLSIKARSLTMLAAIDQVRRKMMQAGQKLEEALKTGHEAEDKYALVQTLAFLCLQASLRSDSQRILESAREGVATAREVHDGFNELRMLAFQCQGLWSIGDLSGALSLAHTILEQAKERGNLYAHGRILNTLGWFHHELGNITEAIAYNQSSAELGRASNSNNVELSALINLCSDYLALDQPARALALLEPTLQRVEVEGFGAHKWRWRMKLRLGLAQHGYLTGEFERALHQVNEALDQARATMSDKYVVEGLVLRGKILTQLGTIEEAGTNYLQATTLADRLGSPSLSFPVAYALGQWYEITGQPEHAAMFYSKAQELVEEITSALDNEVLRSVFLHSESVASISHAVAQTS